MLDPQAPVTVNEQKKKGDGGDGNDEVNYAKSTLAAACEDRRYTLRNDEHLTLNLTYARLLCLCADRQDC